MKNPQSEILANIKMHQGAWNTAQAEARPHSFIFMNGSHYTFNANALMWLAPRQ